MSTKIFCDSCQSDLSVTSNSVAYRILVQVERIPCNEGFVTDMMPAYPLEKDPLHFCCQGCLENYFFAERKKNQTRYLLGELEMRATHESMYVGGGMEKSTKVVSWLAVEGVFERFSKS